MFVTWQGNYFPNQMQIVVWYLVKSRWFWSNKYWNPMFNGNFRILKWRYLPYIRPIFQAYVSEYHHTILPYMGQYLHFRIREISHWYVACQTRCLHPRKWLASPQLPLDKHPYYHRLAGVNPQRLSRSCRGLYPSRIAIKTQFWFANPYFCASKLC